MMYYEIKRMSLAGRSVSKISKALNCNRRTVKKYLEMDDGEFDAFVRTQSCRQKILLPYETFVFDRLVSFRDTSSAQIHDLLKEKHDEFPKVNQKTIYNFVKWIRCKYNLPFEPAIRDYSAVDETPFGLQAQVDFGEYNIRSSNGKRVKVYFFTLVLSRSRYKYVNFSAKPYTTRTAIEAHELAFSFIKGIPTEVVYDQDKVFISNENSGDIILTTQFKKYVRDRHFQYHFCRKSDPESKGKIENVVKYVKQNFLYNRTFHDLATLNTDAVSWLARTANKLEHGSTKRPPVDEWIIEQPLLTPYHPVMIPDLPILLYTVRKDNTISWKSNFYSLPLGTYTGRGTSVSAQNQENELVLFDKNNKELCRHHIPIGTGKKVLKAAHKRDASIATDELISQLHNYSCEGESLDKFIESIKRDKPRYLRDQLLLLLKLIKDIDTGTINRVLDFCNQKGINSVNDLSKILGTFQKAPMDENIQTSAINPLSDEPSIMALIQPLTSNISDYNSIMNPIIN